MKTLHKTMTTIVFLQVVSVFTGCTAQPSALHRLSLAWKTVALP